MPYQQTSYSGPLGGRQHEESYDFADRYGQLAIAMPPMYPQSGTYLSSGPQTLPRIARQTFYEPQPALQPILPPMRMQYGQADAGFQPHRAQNMGNPVTQQPQEEKPVGGVSAKLDYDMEVMTDFVCETAHGLITPGRDMPHSFRKWVRQVLIATRLPSATILLSMFYLASRMPMLVDEPKTDCHLYRLLTIALVLGSKFLDDNTFINRSWSEVSGIPVKDLNELEKVWLIAIGFRLHRDPTEQHGWTSWSEHWQEYQARATARVSRANKLSPIDTAMHRRSLNVNQNKPLPPLPTQQSFNLPSLPPPNYEYSAKPAQQSNNSASSYGHFDPWRSAHENSPASAPTTGPTTPEYYGASGPWAPAEGYSRRTMFGFPPCGFQAHTQPSVFQPQQPSNYRAPAYSGYNTPSWSPTRGYHDYNCGCMSCGGPRHYMNYAMAPQTVAV
jgi:hypothetical protein